LLLRAFSASPFSELEARKWKKRQLAAAFSAPIFHKLGLGPEFCGKIAASFCETTQLMPALRCNLWQHPLAKSKSH
jgi:hypothetical protein